MVEGLGVVIVYIFFFFKFIEHSILFLPPSLSLRYFRLILSPTIESFHPLLQSRSSHPINFSEFFCGHVFGAEFSNVTAHVGRDGLITAVIVMDTETYYIEVGKMNLSDIMLFSSLAFKPTHQGLT